VNRGIAQPMVKRQITTGWSPAFTGELIEHRLAVGIAIENREIVRDAIAGEKTRGCERSLTMIRSEHQYIAEARPISCRRERMEGAQGNVAQNSGRTG